jgi:starch phosphorylase
MVSDYVETAYVPANTASTELSAGNHAAVKDMVAWKKKIEQDWPKITIKSVEVRDEEKAVKGRELEVNVIVDTAGHGPAELNVELLHGPVDLWDNFMVRHVTRLTADGSGPETSGEVLFSGLIPLRDAGQYGYVVQITPNHPNLAFSHKFDLVQRG